MSAKDSTERFSDRVRDYVRYRPGYPAALLGWLEEAVGLTAQDVVADVGSGTGISARLFLGHGNEVFAVEPNLAMRAAAEEALSGHARFHSAAGTAEQTTLPDASVDLVVAAQAFHWFDAAGARREVRRILRPEGHALLVWNERLVTSPLLAAYEQALQEHAIDYARVDHRNVDVERIQTFFGHPDLATATFPNAQSFGREGFFGRALSSSYVPKEGHPQHAAMMAALARIFDEHQKDGRVVFEYVTRAFAGRVA